MVDPSLLLKKEGSYENEISSSPIKLLSFFSSYRNSLENLWGEPSIFSSPGSFPSIDLKDNNNAFVLSMEIPGIKKEDICIDLDKNTLTVSGEKNLKNVKIMNVFILQKLVMVLLQGSFSYRQRLSLMKLWPSIKTGF
jgi:HSP20 family molecular chaperone IbpA